MLAGAASEKGSLLQRVTDAGASPTVSVITPHFERADLLRETRASIRASTRGDWEWLIIDDGSCAEVWEQVRAMADGDRVRVLRRVTGLKGPSTCRNLGVRECRGEYVIFLDSDDLLAPWCLEQRLAAARAQPDAALWVFPALLFAQAPGDGDGYWNTMNPAGDDLGRFLGSDNPWCVSSPLWRGDALRAIGGFNENLHYGDDSDLHIRALLAGLKVRQFPEALPDVFVRRGAEPRLTSSTSPAVVEWRRIRLEEGTRALRQAGARPEHLKLWEGQYFVEAEFLLFNVLDSAGAIHRVLTDWQRQFRPRLTRRAEVLAYFRLALASRKKAYLLIRIARRIAMRLLPRDFFPSRRPSPCPIVPTETMLEVKGRLCLAVSRGGHAIRR
jgi:glycosyltransferase involved in cell wall biosynthesis